MKKNPFVKVLPKSFLFLMVFFLSCQKNWDEPPVYTGPDETANFTIGALRLMHFPGNFEKITEDRFIEGIVVADDQSDNFYKSVLIQDSTGAITLRLDGFGLYADYPVGRKLLVKLKGLWLGDYGNMLQLGIGVDRSNQVYPELLPIPKPLFGRYLVPKSLQNSLAPVKVTIADLSDSLQGCLIELANMEFTPNDTAKPFADAVNQVSVNRTVKSCDGQSIYLRTSGFARFAGIKTPRGNGRITAIYSVFNTAKQLIIRDTSDLQMTGLRCTGTQAKQIFSEDFEHSTPGIPIQIAGWKNLPETGDVYYSGKSFNGNNYAEISAFATGKPTVISWLVLPRIDLNNSTDEVLFFDSKDGFDNGGDLQLLVSSNYDGSEAPWKARWTNLKPVFSKGSVSGIAANWVSSGKISLKGLSGKVSLAFRYEAADPIEIPLKKTTLFQLDNIRILGN
ncbi:MAG: choice-of-anchor J domain-containing protein [Bacteroidota bacterium]|nr:choice-of-anchor J domain-containing protein [Bacteroidota bacterium]